MSVFGVRGIPMPQMHQKIPFLYLTKSGFTGPGSGKHWSDGWDRSDWNAWSGSDSYRAEKSYAEGSGGYGYGGTFKDGNGNRVSVVNGQLQV